MTRRRADRRPAEVLRIYLALARAFEAPRPCVALAARSALARDRLVHSINGDP